MFFWTLLWISQTLFNNVIEISMESSRFRRSLAAIPGDPWIWRTHRDRESFAKVLRLPRSESESTKIRDPVGWRLNATPSFGLIRKAAGRPAKLISRHSRYHLVMPIKSLVCTNNHTELSNWHLSLKRHVKLSVGRESRRFVRFILTASCFKIIRDVCNDVCNTYLDTTFREADFHSYFLPEEDVRVVCSIETPFKLVQLGWCESRPMPFLLGGFVIALSDRRRVSCGRKQIFQSSQIQSNSFSSAMLQIL